MSGPAPAVAFLQGWLVAAVLEAQARALFVGQIDQPTDADGTIEPWFEVTTRSGERLRVTIERVGP